MKIVKRISDESGFKRWRRCVGTHALTDLFCSDYHNNDGYSGTHYVKPLFITVRVLQVQKYFAVSSFNIGKKPNIVKLLIVRSISMFSVKQMWLLIKCN